MSFSSFLTAKEESQEVNFEGIGYIKASRHCHVFYPVFKIIVWLCVSVWLIKDERFICFSLSWEEIGEVVNSLPTVCFSLVTHRWLHKYIVTNMLIIILPILPIYLFPWFYIVKWSLKLLSQCITKVPYDHWCLANLFSLNIKHGFCLLVLCIL